MKYIKKFNEASSIPLYSKGEILVFTKRDLDEKTIEDISKQLGVEYDERYSVGNSEFLIKTPIGQENRVGQDFVDNYPEFFSSFERRDINMEEMFDKIHQTSRRVRDLDEYIGNTLVNPKINSDIDEIIELLKSLKI